ncbi:MAG: ankyrin repeat domain-containing protein [Planctomycetota bacterium]|nr:MAG: ankyrin repeat domain-containing protein [Planctomycetota bacterium]
MSELRALRQALERGEGKDLLARVGAGEVDPDRLFEAVVHTLGGRGRAFLVPLVEAGARLDRPLGELAEPALLFAARRGDVALYRALRRLGASQRVSDALGNTLVHAAALGGNVKILADALAHPQLSPDARNEAGFTPLLCALRRLGSEGAQRRDAKLRKVLEVLLEAGARPSPEELREARERGLRGVSERLRRLGLRVPEAAPEDRSGTTEPLLEPHTPNTTPPPTRRSRTRRLRRRPSS